MQIFEFIRFALSAALFVCWIWMFVDCVKNEEDATERMTWAVGLLFFSIFALPFYYSKRYRPRQKRKKANEKAQVGQITSP
jgi:hypothetical protein